MGILVSFHDEEYFLHGNEFYGLTDLILKAAGYVPHCPCGCSPQKLAWPDATKHHQYKRGYVWRKTPKEPLLTLVHKRECEVTGFYFIPAKHCGAIADRIEGLLGEIKNLDEASQAHVVRLVKAFRDCGKRKRAVVLS